MKNRKHQEWINKLEGKKIFLSINIENSIKHQKFPTLSKVKSMKIKNLQSRKLNPIKLKIPPFDDFQFHKISTSQRSIENNQNLTNQAQSSNYEIEKSKPEILKNERLRQIYKLSELGDLSSKQMHYQNNMQQGESKEKIYNLIKQVQSRANKVQSAEQRVQANLLPYSQQQYSSHYSNVLKRRLSSGGGFRSSGPMEKALNSRNNVKWLYKSIPKPLFGEISKDLQDWNLQSPFDRAQSKNLTLNLLRKVQSQASKMQCRNQVQYKGDYNNNMYDYEQAMLN